MFREGRIISIATVPHDNAKAGIIYIAGSLCGNSMATGRFPEQSPVVHTCEVSFKLNTNKVFK